MHYLGVLIAFIAMPISMWFAHWAGGLVARSRVERAAARAAAAARFEGLRVRADEQHEWSLLGDPRGTFGEYPPAV
ncbi:hypothetical protein [Mycobacterium malmoense]|uniref:hypothetical protein n=1 Tax=Mycobacterium malmoense TaxID=1780 RepID=UPI0008F81D67|nr:hypothetical protein [Mycobacterium malmoense]OIN80848.1 hypothetical protein BMG05_10970 [Mycobacterium malmoense]